MAGASAFVWKALDQLGFISQGLHPPHPYFEEPIVRTESHIPLEVDTT